MTSIHPCQTSTSSAPLIGIEIGGTKLQIVLAEGPQRIIARWRGVADRAGGGRAIQQQIAAGLAELLAAHQATPAAIGVGFGGPIDFTIGRIRRSHQIAGWENFPLRDWLENLSGIPVIVENDANTAALGEAIHGAGIGFDPLFYCNFGSGVGGGLILDGNIYHGAPPGEMEFGHLRLASGRTVEETCSGWAVDAALRRITHADSDSTIAARIGDVSGGEARHLGPLVAAGDSDAIRIFDALTSTISLALSHVVHLLHPRAIVIGGGLAMIGEPLRAAIAERLSDIVMEAFRPIPKVRLSACGEDAVPIGALELAARIAKIGGVRSAGFRGASPDPTPL